MFEFCFLNWFLKLNSIPDQIADWMGIVKLFTASSVLDFDLHLTRKIEKKVYIPIIGNRITDKNLNSKYY